MAAGTTVDLVIRGAEIAGITDPAKITFSDDGLRAIEVKRAMEDVVDLVDELTVTVAVGPLEIDDGQGGTETIPEPTLGLADITLDGVAGETEKLDEVLNVVKMELLGVDGQRLEGVNTIDAQQLNDAARGKWARPIFRFDPGDAIEIEVSFCGPLGNLEPDTIDLTLVDTTRDPPSKRSLALRETGADTRVFSGHPLGEDRFGLDPFTVKLAGDTSFDPASVDEMQVEVTMPTFKGEASMSVVRRTVESGPSTLEFFSLVVDVSVELSGGMDQGQLGALTLTLKADGQEVSGPLSETEPGSLVFTNPEIGTQLSILNMTELGDDQADQLRVKLSCQPLNIVDKCASVQETGVDSMKFAQQKYPAFFRGGGSPDAEVPEAHAFVLRIADVTLSQDSIDAPLEVFTTDNTIENLEPLQLSCVGDGVYESKPVWLITSIGDLSSLARESYGEDYELRRGEGCYFYYKRTRHKGIYTGLPVWGKILRVYIGHEVHERFFYTFKWVDWMTFDVVEKTAQQKGWADTEQVVDFDPEEVVYDLGRMDRDDIFIYLGHNVPGSREIGTGWTDSLTSEQVVHALSSGGPSQEGPGLVIMAGCNTNAWERLFTAAGTRIVVTTNTTTDARANWRFVDRFMMSLLLGNTVANAEASAKAAVGWREAPKYVVVTANGATKSKTLIQAMK